MVRSLKTFRSSQRHLQDSSSELLEYSQNSVIFPRELFPKK